MEKTDDSENLEKEKIRIEKKLSRIFELRDELKGKTAKRLKGKRPDKVKDTETSERINSTDKDCSLMRMKDKSHANAYLKINSMDPKADILVGSVVEGRYDESHNAVKVFNESKRNYSGCVKRYQAVCYDSGFNTQGSCTSFKALDISVIAPTRQYEHGRRCDSAEEDKITHTYNEESNTVLCSEGVILSQKSQHIDPSKGSIIKKFWNKKGCQDCKRRSKCTDNKLGYFQARVDVRQPLQQEVLSRYLSDEGKEIYRKRSHVAETYQADLKKNGRFERFMRRGLEKVRTESLILDMVWNLRRIFNEKGMQIVWS